MKKNISFKIVMVIYLSLIGNVLISAQNFEYKSHINASIASYSMPYRLFIPSGYNSNTSYPLVLFLHGAGERGTDNNAQLNANQGATLWAETANQASYPCFVVAPQCPADKQWVNTNWSLGSYSITNVPMSTELKMVKDIIETLQTQYNIDPSRLYITGLSMGGYGTWDFILRYPTMFKAAIPICGAGDPSKASLIGTMPLRVFHSSDDPTVPVAGSRGMVNAINALGANNRTQFYTEYTDQGHFSWVNAYNTTDLVSWLFTATPISINCTNNPVTGVSINTTSIELISNGTSNLVSTVSPANACNKAITWSSSNTAVASVSSLGFVTAKAGGTATISVTTADGGKIATCTVTVTSGGPAGYIYSCTENATIIVSGTMDIAYGANGSYLYKYNQTADCGCNSNTFGGDPISGVLKACYSKAIGGTVAVIGVTMSPTALSIGVNTTSQLTAIVTPESATDKSLNWSSSNSSIVTVSTSGLVLGKSVGNATITATTADGSKTATCAVTVTTATAIIKETGTAYRWYGNAISTSNSNNVEAPGLNDSNLTTDVSLAGGSEETFANAYEAAGLIFSSAKTITKVEFVNGTFAGIVNGVMDDGCFDEDFKLQTTVDGSTWTDVSGWTVSPAYEYWSTSVSGATFTFTSSTADVLGIRVTGKVRTSESTGSWEARVREITAYSGQITGVPTTQKESDIFLYSNPDNSNLTLANVQPNSVIKVVSMNGSIISEVLAKSETVKFDVSHWPKGVYIFYVKTGSNEVIKKAVIQ